MRPQSEPSGHSFPDFADGDVRIVLTGSRQYQLHSGVLKNASTVMQELLGEGYAAQLNNAAHRRGVIIRHKLVLVDNPNLEEEDSNLIYVFEPIPLDPQGRPVQGTSQGMGLELENGRRIPPILMAYDAVLGAFYNQPINLGDSQEDGLAELLGNAFQATIVAENLNCIRIISKPIEATLLGAGQNLYKAIADNPTAWLGFASRVKSRAIFKEAMIHAAGQFSQPTVQAAMTDGSLPDEVVKVLKRKGAWVKKTVSDSSRYLASYYPSMLLREFKPGDKDNVSRASYGNDIMMWIAVTIFRHWVCDMMASDKTHQAKDCGWAWCDVITVGGDKYLDRKMLQSSFHSRFPMTGKGMACVEHRLAEVKDDVKQWITPLKKTNSALDLHAHPVKHFLHANVHSDDYPWDDVTLEPTGDYSDEEQDEAITIEDDMTVTYPDGSDDDQEIRNMGGFIEESSDMGDDENVEMADASALHYRPETPIFFLDGAAGEDADAGESTDEYSEDEAASLVAKAQEEQDAEMQRIIRARMRNAR